VGGADFVTALTRLSSDADFARRVAREPEKAVEDAGYSLSSTELEKVRSAAQEAASASNSSEGQGTHEVYPQGQVEDWGEEAAEHRKLQLEAVRHRVERGMILQNYTADLFKTTLDNAARTYRSISLMNKVLFWLGVGLVIASAIYGAVTGDQLLATAFGTIGAGTIFGLFLLGPITRSQHALSNLVQSEIAFMNYFEQITLWDAYALTPTGFPPALNQDNIARASVELQKRSAETMALLEEYTEAPTKQQPNETHGEHSENLPSSDGHHGGTEGSAEPISPLSSETPQN
jgi:hypothetical protein